MNIPKIASISKKMLVALLGAFLCLFLLFHAGANLLILRHDGGAWYNAFCHFMGTNVIVKVFEIILLATFVFHIILSLVLAWQNKKARPIGYHKPSKTKTHKASKFQVWTGILILACLFLHFTDFYFVKHDITKGRYMVKAEVVNVDIVDCDYFDQIAQEEGGKDWLDWLDTMYNFEMLNVEDNSQKEEIQKTYDELRNNFIISKILGTAPKTSDGVWITNLSYEDREILSKAGIETEPDFYNQALIKFKVWHIALCYLLFFVVVWFHLRHGFAAMFQTLGLYNNKYGKAIEILSDIFAITVCLMFAITVIFVFVGL
ncbi:MAG: hypothetical protein J5605_09580 [Bacteroidales bacterium]|nr:hypothetical protein [Bacteroidales bacterium]